jgi:hypothetical protein
MHPNASALLSKPPKRRVLGTAGLLLFLVCSAAISAAADDAVTIPRSRLEELERKEAELKRLQGGDPTPKPEQKPTPPAEPPVAATNAVANAPLPTPASVQSLPALSPGEVVPAVDIAAHYAANPAAADQRYRKRKFQTVGEIAGFEKPMFTRNYKILLKTQGQPRVVCDFYLPDQYGMVYTIKHGAELVATLGERSRVTLAKTGQKVVIEGQGSGGDASTVKLTRCQIKSARD